MMQIPTGSAPPVDMGSFLFVFRPNVAIPQFCVAYRWWEDEAINMLWAYDFNDISQAIRFGLFHDESSPRSSLLSRNMQFINEFLLAASKPYEHCRLSELSHPQKVEEILLRSSIPQRPLLTWNWIPTISGGSSDPRTIALEIEAESYFHFQQIAFEDIVRSALGYKAVSVEWFLQQHTSLYGILVNHLHMYPEELLLYLEVEKHLRDRSPFAHQALAKCIMAIQPDGKHNMPSRNTPGFAFIAAPIQQLFKNHSSSLSTIFKVLSVLAELYEARNYYSIMAILDGLCKYIAVGSNTFRAFDASRTVVTPTSLIPPKVLPLIDPSHNFASYRKRYDQHPGIPFLQPHIREFRQCGKSAQQPLLRLFQAITSSQREDNDPVSC
ncbi:hypothetical protein N7489_004769 [Penicillium chrysogenum]|uniref:uncharacterized protein n=1 Tax=Penicillium chrysogenum TaxID=5076 RepID=UPI0024DF0DD3|nr:uncharacterized protein N7489_004769 [Penicillium chrysogenum]KAJ5244673.1 hypothetical protein N7489_004769 [Penicillium chrysogenum]